MRKFSDAPYDLSPFLENKDMNFLNKFLKEEDGITAIEYAIIGVAMSAALYYIFDEGGFLESLEDAWGDMEKNIDKSGKVLGQA